jgi:Tfp pilus assembly ATPase PilU
LFVLYKEGRISLEQALINADSANNLRLKIKLAGLKCDQEPDMSELVAKEQKHLPQGALKTNNAFRLRA